MKMKSSAAYSILGLLLLFLLESANCEDERHLQVREVSPRELTNCFQCVSYNYFWRLGSCTNQYIYKIDAVNDGDNIAECYNIWRATRAVGAWVPPIPISEYIQNKDREDIVLERECKYQGQEMLVVITNNAYWGFWYYKPTLYIRGLVDGSGRMSDHKNGNRYWSNMQSLEY